MKRGIACLLTPVLLCGFGVTQTHGLKPRASAGQYPTSQQAKEFAIGAEQLSNAEAEHAFATPLDRRYIVIEVGLFPATGSAPKITAEDFTLKVSGANQMIRPAAPQTIAEVLHRKPASSRDVTLYPAGSVGYESGGRDPYGNRYPGGVGTSAGVGVGIDKKQTGATEADRKVMETELRDKALPEGELIKPAAGYLYFPVVSKPSKKAVSYELEYAANGQTVRLALTTPSE